MKHAEPRKHMTIADVTASMITWIPACNHETFFVDSLKTVCTQSRSMNISLAKKVYPLFNQGNWPFLDKETKDIPDDSLSDVQISKFPQEQHTVRFRW